MPVLLMTLTQLEEGCFKASFFKPSLAFIFLCVTVGA